MEVRVECPFPEHAAPRVWAWMQEFRWRVSDDFGPRTLEEFMGQWLAGQGQTWGVWRDGELGGMISAERLSGVVTSMHCVFRKDFWGHATTEPACRMAIEDVFAGGAQKILSLVFWDNKQIIGLARKLGFAREGLLRKHARRQGRLVDMVALGLTREDWNRDAAVGTTGVHGRLGARGGLGRPQVSEDEHVQPIEHGEHVEPGAQVLAA